jgi:hypothetical protein
MIGDPELKVAKLYDMLPAEAGDTSEGRTGADNATVRAVFIIGPDKKIKAMLTYPMTSGRNFDEALRLLDSLQLTAKQPVATPVNWKPGDDVIIVPSLSDEKAREKFPGGWDRLSRAPNDANAADVVSPARAPTHQHGGRAAGRLHRDHAATPHRSLLPGPSRDALSGRIGGAPGSVTVGNRRSRELRGETWS